MSTTTQRLGLFKYDTVADSAVPFNIDDALNYNWDILEQKVGPNRNVGEIIASSLPLIDAGLHLLDGALILGDGIYSEFVEYIANLYTDNPNANYFTDETTWQDSISQYGVCGKFVYDSLANTVRLPKITGILEGTTDVGALGDLIQAGLPTMTTNSTGNHNHSLWAEVWRGSDGNNWRVAWDGGDRHIGSATAYTNSTGAHTHTVTWGADVNTVQPQTIKAFYYIVIANSTKTDIQVDIDEIATDLNDKVDKADLEEVQCVVETYVNGTSWYRVYSDGWCEQGGRATISSYYANITFLKQFLDTNYSIVFAQKSITEDTYCANVENFTNSTMQLRVRGGGTFCFWEARGYIEV